MTRVVFYPVADALREVKKYSTADQSKDSKLLPNMLDHVHMKLFRAQRNLYISGFSLFLWLYALIHMNDVTHWQCVL